jgi:hypothetical protein
MKNTDYETDTWLKSVHITPKYLADTDIETEFLMAQREAETILKSFATYLTASQSYQLCHYLKCLSKRKKREVMPINSAYRVLNIASSVNRKLFATHKRLEQSRKTK